MENPILKIITTMDKRGAHESHIKRNHNITPFSLIGIATVSHGKNFFDQKQH